MYFCPEVQDPSNTAGLSPESAPCTIYVLTPQITIKLWGRSRGKKPSKNQAVDKLQQCRPKVVYQYSAYLNFWVFSYLQFPPPHHAFLLVTCFLFLAFDFGNTEVSVSPRTGWGILEPLYAGCVCAPRSSQRPCSRCPRWWLLEQICPTCFALTLATHNIQDSGFELTSGVFNNMKRMP